MTNSINIESIVEAVVQRLRRVESDAAATNSTAQTQLGSPTHAAAPQGVLSLEQSVVSLAQLRDIPNDLTTIQVTSNAVVTPAVLDELRAKKIELKRTANTENGTTETADILVIGTPQLASSVSRSRNLLGCKTTTCGEKIDEAARAVSQRIVNNSSSRTVWHTSKPFAASLVSQGRGKTRAVQLIHPNQLAQATQEASPNLLILDSAHWVDAAVVRLLTQWSQVKK